MKYLGAGGCDLAADKRRYVDATSKGISRISNRNRVTLLGRVEEYYNAPPDVHKIAQLDEMSRSPYEPLKRIKRRTAIAEMRQNLLTKGGASCPYCGEVAVPNALDHFLPEELYPEFAILSANLIPICTPCNSAKGTSILEHDGSNAFFNSYFHAQLAQRLVEGKIEWNGPIPAFQLVALRSLGIAVKNTVSRHLKNCDVQERFHISASQIFRNWRDAQLTADRYPKAELRATFWRAIRRDERGHGPNNWNSISLRALLADKTAWAFLNP